MDNKKTSGASRRKRTRVPTMRDLPRLRREQKKAIKEHQEASKAHENNLNNHRMMIRKQDKSFETLEKNIWKQMQLEKAEGERFFTENYKKLTKEKANDVRDRLNKHANAAIEKLMKSKEFLKKSREALMRKEKNLERINRSIERITSKK